MRVTKILLMKKAKKMRVIRLSTPPNDAAFDALVSTKHYLLNFEPINKVERFKKEKALRAIKSLLIEVRNRENGEHI